MVVRNKDVLGGSPTVNGRRINIFNLISGLWYSSFVGDYLKDMEISESDAVDALSFCKAKLCVSHHDLDYCEHCLLGYLQEQNTDINTADLEKYTVSGSNCVVNINGVEVAHLHPYEPEDIVEGRPGWILAAQLLQERFGV